MRNVFALRERPGEEAPSQIYGWRPYALAFSASWACKNLSPDDVASVDTRQLLCTVTIQLSLVAH